MTYSGGVMGIFVVHNFGYLKKTLRLIPKITMTPSNSMILSVFSKENNRNISVQ